DPYADGFTSVPSSPATASPTFCAPRRFASTRGTTPTRVTDWLSFCGRRASVMTTWTSSSEARFSASSAARMKRGVKQTKESAAPTTIGRIQQANEYHFQFQEDKGKRWREPSSTAARNVSAELYRCRGPRVNAGAAPEDERLVS